MATAKTSVLHRDVTKAAAEIIDNMAFDTKEVRKPGNDQHEFHRQLGKRLSEAIDWKEVKQRLKHANYE
jgi:ABC-type phosphate transport system ATPase subunit